MSSLPAFIAILGIVFMGAGTDALFGQTLPFEQSSLTQACAKELHTVAPNCVTSMFNDVQDLKSQVKEINNKDTLLQQDLEAERKTVSELRQEVDYLSVRITHGSEYMGTAEVYVRGRWGTICDLGWDQEDANLFCQMVGFKSGKVWTATRSSLPYMMSNMKCSGEENSIFDCEHTDLSSASLCPTGHVATVKCDIGIRVVAGPDTKHGRVEISHRGEWGTICDNEWDDNDATVVCRMMGYYEGGRAVNMAVFGPGTNRILLSRVNCTGSESSILDCRKPYFGLHDCTHQEDAGVVCN